MNGSRGVLRAPRFAALVTVASLVAAASLVSFAESYRGLYLWAARHSLSGGWAVLWPLQVDVFIAVGELALFVALVDRWPARSRAGAWAVTAAGLAVSVAGNVGHAPAHGLATRVTFAIPPVAAAFALAVGLGVLKRVVEAGQVPDSASAPASARPRLPTLREIQARQGCGQETAKKVRAELAAFARGQGGASAVPRAARSDAPALATQDSRPGQILPESPTVPAGALLNGDQSQEGSTS